ncbi:DNA topoisomerase I [Synechococcus sp. C9]|nr:DNA topoisomerase I [Synechococcus sp. C9]
MDSILAKLRDLLRRLIDILLGPQPEAEPIPVPVDDRR